MLPQPAPALLSSVLHRSTDITPCQALTPCTLHQACPPHARLLPCKPGPAAIFQSNSSHRHPDPLETPDRSNQIALNHAKNNLRNASPPHFPCELFILYAARSLPPRFIGAVLKFGSFGAPHRPSTGPPTISRLCPLFQPTSSDPQHRPFPPKFAVPNSESVPILTPPFTFSFL